MNALPTQRVTRSSSMRDLASRVLPFVSRYVGAARRRWLVPWGMAVTANDRRLMGLRGKHCGQRAFVIGNGPSLKASDLSLLTNEITFASNKIYLMFPETEWRPTYYHVSDILVASQNTTEILSVPGTQLIADCCRPLVSQASEPIWLNELPRSLRDLRLRRGRFSSDLCQGVCGGSTVVHHQLQAAFYMGIHEVYLLGMDFSFVHADAPVGYSAHGRVLSASGAVNHFSKAYRKPGEAWTMPRLDLQVLAFDAAKVAFDEDGRKVYNASRQSKLEVFDRADLDVVLA